MNQEEKANPQRCRKVTDVTKFADTSVSPE